MPVLGESGLATVNTRIMIEKDYLIPTCKDCGQTMNEIYIVSGCSLQEAESVHIHFSHRHYEQNMNYRTHFCIASKKFYEFPKSH
jgi:hypothetical protein